MATLSEVRVRYPRVQCSGVASSAATCADAPTPPDIDVAALSRGRRDGIYYAGRRLTPWMDRGECSEMFRLSTSSNAETRARLAELRHRQRVQSKVVRWEIKDGLPGAVKELHDRQPDYVAESRGEMYIDCAFLWGAGENRDIYHLGHALLGDALGVGRSSNDHPWIHNLVVRLGDLWVLPEHGLVQRAAVEDLRRAVEVAWARARISVTDLEQSAVNAMEQALMEAAT